MPDKEFSRHICLASWQTCYQHRLSKMCYGSMCQVSSNYWKLLIMLFWVLAINSSVKVVSIWCVARGAEFIPMDHACDSIIKMLSHMLRAEGFTGPPLQLHLSGCKEPSVPFENPTNLSSVKRLVLWGCKLEPLPRNLKLLTRPEEFQCLHFR